jgi:type II secretory pathway pseudopilin PulG
MKALAFHGLNSRERGFTLVDAMLATAICGFAITALFAATGQALHVVKAAREAGCASELLQQRMERFRASSPWSNLASPSTAATMVSTATEIGPSLPGATEIFTFSDYPSDGNSFTVTRNAGGTVTTTGSALPSTQRCVAISGKVTWTGWSGLNRSRTLLTIITKGGITP